MRQGCGIWPAVIAGILVMTANAARGGEDALAPDAPGEKLLTRLYSVADLVVPLAGGGAPSTDSDCFESLIDLIELHTGTDCWKERGGSGEVRTDAKSLALMIRQTPAIHDRIAALLDELRGTDSLAIGVDMAVFCGGEPLSAKAWAPGRSPFGLVDPAGRQRLLDGLYTASNPQAVVVTRPQITFFNGGTASIQVDEHQSVTMNGVISSDQRYLRLNVDTNFNGDTKHSEVVVPDGYTVVQQMVPERTWGLLTVRIINSDQPQEVSQGRIEPSPRPNSKRYLVPAEEPSTGDAEVVTGWISTAPAPDETYDIGELDFRILPPREGSCEVVAGLRLTAPPLGLIVPPLVGSRLVEGHSAAQPTINLVQATQVEQPVIPPLPEPQNDPLTSDTEARTARIDFVQTAGAQVEAALQSAGEEATRIDFTDASGTLMEGPLHSAVSGHWPTGIHAPALAGSQVVIQGSAESPDRVFVDRETCVPPLRWTGPAPVRVAPQDRPLMNLLHLPAPPRPLRDSITFFLRPVPEAPQPSQEASSRIMVVQASAEQSQPGLGSRLSAIAHELELAGFPDEARAVEQVGRRVSAAAAERVEQIDVEMARLRAERERLQRAAETKPMPVEDIVR